jgi:hypothetical protein
LQSTEKSFAQTFLKEHFARPLPHFDDVFLQQRFVEEEAASLRLAEPFDFAQGRLARRPFPHNLIPYPLSAQQGTGQAGGAAAAVDAEFIASEGADVEAGCAQARVGFAVLFDSQQALAAEGEDVASQRVALGGVDLDEAVAA